MVLQLAYPVGLSVKALELPLAKTADLPLALSYCVAPAPGGSQEFSG